MTSLSVIIPCYNHLDDVLRCVNTLGMACVCANELLLQDDCSPALDYTTPGLFPMAQVERNPVNIGFGATCNRAAQRSRGDVLLFVNQDVYATERSHGWDAAILAAFNDPTVGIVGARLLFPNGAIQSAGGLLDARCQPFHRCLGWSDADHPEVAERIEVTWVTGAALAIRRELFLQIGGFDPIYAPSYFEDVDLCLRVQESGYKVLYEPASTLYHTVASTGGSPHFMRSALRFRERWVDTGRVKPDASFVAAGWW